MAGVFPISAQLLEKFVPENYLDDLLNITDI